MPKKLAKILKYIIKITVLVVLIPLSLKLYNMYLEYYKPEEKKYITSSRLAYKKLSEEIFKIYKENKYIYKKTNENPDSVCIKLAQNLSDGKYDCTNSDGSPEKLNFTIKKTNISIYGLEKNGYMLGDTIVKDFFIDINSQKGENKFGVDRAPLRLYSTGRWGGLLTPVNCNNQAEEDFNLPTGEVCPDEIQINFMDTNIPFGFTINQMASDKGVVETLGRNLPFLRADCHAFGGEISDEYCEERKYYWLRGCYIETYCGIELTK